MSSKGYALVWSIWIEITWRIFSYSTNSVMLLYGAYGLKLKAVKPLNMKFGCYALVWSIWIEITTQLGF